jgi:hypothetical protein
MSGNPVSHSNVRKTLPEPGNCSTLTGPLRPARLEQSSPRAATRAASRPPEPRATKSRHLRRNSASARLRCIGPSQSRSRRRSRPLPHHVQSIAMPGGVRPPLQYRLSTAQDQTDIHTSLFSSAVGQSSSVDHSHQARSRFELPGHRVAPSRSTHARSPAAQDPRHVGP